MSRFVAVALDPGGEPLAAVRRFEGRIGPSGAQNGLIELVLKLTVTGVPDIYQGAELWEQSLVDPDNRRPVDFTRRREAISRDLDIGTLTTEWRTGEIKQRIVRQLLNIRSEFPQLFEAGDYAPLSVDQADESILAFTRWHGDDGLLVCVRLYPWRSRPRENARIELPAVPCSFSCVLGDFALEQRIATARFERLPFAVATLTR